MSTNTEHLPGDWDSRSIIINQDKYKFTGLKDDDGNLIYKTENGKLIQRFNSKVIPYYLGDIDHTPSLLLKVLKKVGGKGVQDLSKLKNKVVLELDSLETFKESRDKGQSDEALYDRYNDVLTSKEWMRHYL